MSALSINPPFPVFTDIDGQPLEAGYIFIGTANLDPQTNPINVFFDEALTIPAAQPIRTLAGYPAFNGTPARLYVGSNDYSIRVKNKNGSTVYSAASGAESISAGLVSFVGFKGQVGTVEDLADDDGSDWIGFEQPGGSAVARSVQDKLREIASRADFVDDAAFLAGKGDKPNIDGNDNFDAKVTPVGESQINLSEALLTATSSNRAAVRYQSPTSVSISCARNILMGGFRFFGQFSKGRAPMFSRSTGGQQAVSLTTDLGAESAAHLDGWYAVFACANDGDAAPVFKLMPCLRAGSVLGSQVTLCSAAEGIHTNTATTYNWSSVNNLNGVDCLIINETVDGRANAFSGRVTTITANTTTTVTLGTVGTVGTLDWLLPAPPGFDHYCYQGMFYYETPGDVRNIGDSGSLVKAKMINTADPNWSATGQVATPASPVAIRFGGYISPLATAVIVKETSSFSTSALGSYAAYFDIDGSQHVVESVYGQKEGTPTETMLWDGITVPFCFKQEFYYSNDGSLIALRSGGTLEITGWIEL